MAAKDHKKKEAKPGVKLADLVFYFDGVERDRLDATGWSRRSAELLQLRERLLKLRNEDFDAAIKTMKNVLRDAVAGADTAETAEASQVKRAAAMKLFEQVQGGTRG